MKHFLLLLLMILLILPGCQTKNNMPKMREGGQVRILLLTNVLLEIYGSGPLRRE